MDLNQITVACFDYEASVEFYKELGLRQIVDSPPRYARFETPAGSTFSIHKRERNTVDSGIVVYFEVADLDAKYRELVGNGRGFRLGA